MTITKNNKIISWGLQIILGLIFSSIVSESNNFAGLLGGLVAFLIIVHIISAIFLALISIAKPKVDYLKIVKIVSIVWCLIGIIGTLANQGKI